MASRSTFRKRAKLKESLLATGFPSHKRHKNPNIYFYHQITLHTHGVRRAGSAALDLCNVAVWTLRRLLGIQSQSVGYRGGRADRRGGRRQSDAFRWIAL